jgi:hypothetical protein
MVHQAIQHHLVTGPERPPLPQPAPGVVSVACSATSPGTLEVRVELHGVTTRVFTLTVEEQ